MNLPLSNFHYRSVKSHNRVPYIYVCLWVGGRGVKLPVLLNPLGISRTYRDLIIYILTLPMDAHL